MSENVLSFPTSQDVEKVIMERQKIIENGGGPPNNGDMDARIAVLEHQAKSAEERMGRIEDKLDRLLETTSKLPTTNGLWGMVATVIGVCAASLSVIVAILTWLQGFHH